MRMRKAAAMLLVFFVLVLGALAAPSVKGEKTYSEHSKIVLTADDVSDKAQILWDVTGTSEPDVEEVGGKLYVWAKPGKYVASMVAIDFEAKKVQRAKFTFTVEGKPPGPLPPKPPDPKPPDPKPDDGPAPIPIDGFRVLIVYESADLAKMPSAQNAVLYSRTIREYLDSKCAQGTKNKEWRIWDKDLDATAEARHWQEALKRGAEKASAWKPEKDKEGNIVGPKVAYPWIMISTGKTGHEGPLPANVAKTMELLEKYGGARR